MAEPSSVKCWSRCFGRSAAFLDLNVATGATGGGRYARVFLVHWDNSDDASGNALLAISPSAGELRMLTWYVYP